MKNRALIIVDIQKDYFEGGKWTLHNIDEATANSARILAEFRQNKDSVFHVRHINKTKTAPFFVEGTPGADIHPSVEPLESEPLFTKGTVNPFVSTNLLEALKEKSIDHVVVIGAMSHMCIDATARAASDFGFEVSVIEDACAAKDLELNGKTVPADLVHRAFMAPLAFSYANVLTTDEWLSNQ